MVNGLGSMGTHVFCSQLGDKLRKERLDVIVDFVQPEEHTLPPVGYVTTKVLLFTAASCPEVVFESDEINDKFLK